MFCKECGKEIENEGTYCSNCGEKLEFVEMETPGLYQSEDELPILLPQKGNIGKIIIFIAALCVVISTGVFAYSTFREETNNNYAVEKNESIVDEENEQNNISSQSEIEEKLNDANEEKTETQIDNNGYASYFCSSYEFECKYPSWFSIKSNEESFFSCVAPDESGSMDICGMSANGKTVQQNMYNYISSYDGTVDYKASGEDFFAVRLKAESTYYYRYAKFVDGEMFTFSFEFPKAQFDTYDYMINYIYSEFIKQFK